MFRYGCKCAVVQNQPRFVEKHGYEAVNQQMDPDLVGPSDCAAKGGGRSGKPNPGVTTVSQLQYLRDPHKIKWTCTYDQRWKESR